MGLVKAQMFEAPDDLEAICENCCWLEDATDILHYCGKSSPTLDEDGDIDNTYVDLSDTCSEWSAKEGPF